MPDDRCADLRDESDDDCVRAVQGFHDVGFLTPAKRVFVERADDVPVARLLNPEDRVNHAPAPTGSSNSG